MECATAGSFLTDGSLSCQHVASAVRTPGVPADCRRPVSAWSPVGPGLNPAAKRIDEILAGRLRACPWARVRPLEPGKLEYRVFVAIFEFFGANNLAAIIDPQHLVHIFRSGTPSCGGLAAAGTLLFSSGAFIRPAR
jgi:hypothetical protein